MDEMNRSISITLSTHASNRFCRISSKLLFLGSSPSIRICTSCYGNSLLDARTRSVNVEFKWSIRFCRLLISRFKYRYSFSVAASIPAPSLCFVNPLRLPPGVSCQPISVPRPSALSEWTNTVHVHLKDPAPYKNAFCFISHTLWPPSSSRNLDHILLG